ncbi:MAG: DUF4870 domain-containing protein [Phycisphaerae bacterium]|nr:DUF4870 domain-containing protein [Phycisphaerae bacterium]
MPVEPTGSGRFVDSGADSGERTYALFNHLIGLISTASGGIPLGGLIGTIIMWRIKAKESPFLDDHGREAVNFQLSQLAFIAGGMAAAAVLGVISLGLAAPLIAVGAVIGTVGLTVLNLVGCIRGAMAANRREYYRYPMCIRFIGAPDEAG